MICDDPEIPKYHGRDHLRSFYFFKNIAGNVVGWTSHLGALLFFTSNGVLWGRFLSARKFSAVRG